MTGAAPGERAEPIGADGLVDAVVQTAFVVAATLTRVGAEHDLSLTQLRVLAILRDRRLRMSDLADNLGLEKSTLSGLVDRAERRGLLARLPNEVDRRVVDVVLGPAAVALAERLTTDVGRALAPLTETLAPAERRRLQSLLEQMLAPSGAERARAL